MIQNYMTLSVLVAPSADRQTLIVSKWILKPRKKLLPKSVLPQPRLLIKQAVRDSLKRAPPQEFL